MTDWNDKATKAAESEKHRQKAYALLKELDKYEKVTVDKFEIHGDFISCDLEFIDECNFELWDKVMEPIKQYDPVFYPIRRDKNSYDAFMHIYFNLIGSESVDEDKFKLKEGYVKYKDMTNRVLEYAKEIKGADE